MVFVTSIIRSIRTTSPDLVCKERLSGFIKPKIDWRLLEIPALKPGLDLVPRSETGFVEESITRCRQQRQATDNQVQKLRLTVHNTINRSKSITIATKVHSPHKVHARKEEKKHDNDIYASVKNYFIFPLSCCAVCVAAFAAFAALLPLPPLLPCCLLLLLLPCYLAVLAAFGRPIGSFSHPAIPSHSGVQQSELVQPLPANRSRGISAISKNRLPSLAL
ncbi:hypothetical protein OUZ56_003578 [Daphnia magna]|uniref:Uncharacterized protein n=1 Tax=Daphnia magna TaxID=35525 RepID=A0ABR0A9E2_9CRUS|nr:hypothetical protein OUZ56_003578 [Daphnia magna]